MTFRAPACMVIVTATLVLAACSRPAAVTAVGGTLDVLGPDAAFVEAINKRTLPDAWTLSGDVGANTLSIRSVDSLPALHVEANGETFALMRRVRAPLLAMPYLSWAWYVKPPRHGAHPVRLIVGLADRTKKAEQPWWRFGPPDGPKINRIITVMWDGTALGRGTVIGPDPRSKGVPTVQYVARGGPEQGSRWWVDTVDLSLIHRQAWPNDDPSLMDVRLIGIAARPEKAPAAMNLATFRLTR